MSSFKYLAILAPLTLLTDAQPSCAQIYWGAENRIGRAHAISPEYRNFLFGESGSPTFQPHRPVHVAAPRYVPYAGGEIAGTIIIDTRKMTLLLVLGGRALVYPIGVGREGYTWRGIEWISRKAEWPSWTPTAGMLKQRPDLPLSMTGGPDNPLGSRAIYLGQSLYRIHGTNEPETIGTTSSSGCFRMLNTHVNDLYERVRIGAKVIVI